MRRNHGNPTACGEPLKNIHREHDYSSGFAQNTHSIGRSDIPAAHGTDVNSPGLRHQIPGRHRPEQVGNNDGQYVCANFQSS